MENIDGHPKQSSSEKKYAQLSNSSIQTLVKSVVNKPLSDDVLQLLNENSNFVLRSLLSSALQYTKNEHRRMLTIDDFNKTLEETSYRPIYGYKGTQAISYDKTINRKNPENSLYMEKEIEMNLYNISTSNKLYETVLPEIRFTWGTIENKVCLPFYFKTASGKTVEYSDTSIPSVLNEYFEAITDVICGSNKADFKFVLSDLKKNPNISSLLPKLTYFLKSAINVLCESNDFSELSKLLLVIQSIVSNPYLYIGHQPYITVLTECVLNCMTAPVKTYVDNHWIVRDNAAELLSKLYHDWASPVNKLCEKTLKQLEAVLTNYSMEFSCHYGAVVGIMAFGVEAIEKYIIPNMESYMVHLNKARSDYSYEKAQIKSDAQEVYNVLLNVSVQVTLSCIKKIIAEPDSESEEKYTFNNKKNKKDKDENEKNDIADSKEQLNKVRKLYKFFYEQFGNAFKHFVPLDTLTKSDVNVALKNKRIKLFSRNKLIDESNSFEKWEKSRNKHKFLKDLKSKKKKKDSTSLKSDNEYSFSDDEENNRLEKRKDFTYDNDSSHSSGLFHRNIDSLHGDNFHSNFEPNKTTSLQYNENSFSRSGNSSDDSSPSENDSSNSNSNETGGFKVVNLGKDNMLKIIICKDKT